MEQSLYTYLELCTNEISIAKLAAKHEHKVHKLASYMYLRSCEACTLHYKALLNTRDYCDTTQILNTLLWNARRLQQTRTIEVTTQVLIWKPCNICGSGDIVVIRLNTHRRLWSFRSLSLVECTVSLNYHTSYAYVSELTQIYWEHAHKTTCLHHPIHHVICCRQDSHIATCQHWAALGRWFT